MESFNDLKDKNNLILTIGKPQKINSVFAKYNSIGQLSCIICNQIIKSDHLWNKHLISKTHLENKKKFKKKIEAENNIETETINVPRSTKRNISESVFEDESNSCLDISEIKKKKLENNLEANSYHEEVNNSEFVPGVLPEGFYDSNKKEEISRETMKLHDINTEFEEFKKIIHREESETEFNGLMDEKIRDFGRELEEVQELIFRWEKIENFHNKRDELRDKNKLIKTDNSLNENESDEEDIELDLDDVINISLQTKKRY